MDRFRDAATRPQEPRVDFTRANRRPGHARTRTGHRRDAGGSPDRRSFPDRLQGALVDVAVHRAVAYRDLVDAHFDGHPYAGRRGVDRLVRNGHLAEHKVKGPKGGTFTVLTATEGGARAADRLLAQRGYAPGQATWSGLGRQGDLEHDLAIYRAVREARAQLEAQGATVRRVRLDGELRRTVLRRAEKARARGGRAAADAERRRAAEELGLPVLPNGKVLYPDAQIEHARSDDSRAAEPGRVNIEVATEHYRGGSIAAKANAGFAIAATNARAARAVAAAGAGGRGRSGFGGGKGSDEPTGGGSRDRDPASVEL